MGRMTQLQATVLEGLFASRSTSYQKSSPSRYRQNTEANGSWQRKDDYETLQCLGAMNAFAQRSIIHVEGSFLYHSPPHRASSICTSICALFLYLFSRGLSGVPLGRRSQLYAVLGCCFWVHDFWFFIIRTMAFFFCYSYIIPLIQHPQPVSEQPLLVSTPHTIVIYHLPGQGPAVSCTHLVLDGGQAVHEPGHARRGSHCRRLAHLARRRATPINWSRKRRTRRWSWFGPR